MSDAKIIDYGNGIFALDQGMVRMFLIVGNNRALLFDAGVEKAPVMELIRRITKLPVELCLSHSDHDHTANAGLFDSLYIHEAEIERYEKNGRPKGQELKPLREGFCFELGGRGLTVLHCPGHTPGSIALLDSKEGLIFPGDTLSHASVFMFGDGREDEAYLKTLERLEGLYEEGDFGIIYPCHGECPLKLIEGKTADASETLDMKKACEAPDMKNVCGKEADMKNTCGGSEGPGTGSRTPMRELMDCMNAIASGSIKGTASAFRDPEGRQVYDYRLGDCGILHI